MPKLQETRQEVRSISHDLSERGQKNYKTHKRGDEEMQRYTNDKPLKVVTLCSGYDSQCMALDRIGIPYELVAWSEVDKYAIIAHNAIYPQFRDRNLGDMTKIDWKKVEGEIDLLTYSTPCQDFSIAGLQRGGEEGSNTRSSLLWHTRNAILEKRPKYLMFENVRGLVSKKFFPLFQRWIDELSSYGYKSFWKVLNAADFGIPQHRERVFLISIRDDGDSPDFYFPAAEELKKCIKDMLEDRVDEKYNLSDAKDVKFIKR